MLIGSEIVRYKRLSSTNEYALEWLKKDHPKEGTVVLTDHQFEGKGQHGNKWISDANQNITVSIILYPTFLSTNQSFLLNKAVAISVSDTIQALVKEKVKIKWPNDILIDEKKVCGILIQNSMIGMSMNHSVVGIGMNVNQNKWPSGLHATSLRVVLDQLLNVGEVLEVLFNQVDKWYGKLRANQHSLIENEYNDRLYGLDQNLFYKEVAGDRILEGKIIEVNSEGKLLLQTRNKRYTFAFKEIELLRDYEGSHSDHRR